MGCYNCGASNVVSGLCGMCQYWQTRTHTLQMQQQRFMEHQAHMMRQQPMPMYGGYAPQYNMMPQATFHIVWFLFIGWWLSMFLVSLVFPLFLLLFSGGRKMFLAAIGYW